MGLLPQISPHFWSSDDGEDIMIDLLFYQHLSKSFREGTHAVFGPVEGVLIEHQALSEQRMRAVFHGVGSQPPVIIRTLSRTPQQAQQRNG